MYEFEGNHDTLITGIVQPKLMVAWSRRRAWHGETVSIQVRTELVNDGTSIKLEVHAGSSAGVVMDTFDSETVTGNKLDKPYKIDWQAKKPKEEPHTFLVKATIADLKLTAESAPMAVDLTPPIFSA